MQPSDPTPERILAAAEALFAERGLSVPVRMITAAAGVNVAAINYHFHDKDNLINAVLARRLEPLAKARLQALARLEARAVPPSAAELLAAFFAPALRMAQGSTEGRGFMRLIGRLHADSPGTARRRLSRHFDAVVDRYRQALGRALPHLPERTLRLRFRFVIGAMSHTMARFDRIEEATGQVSIDEVLQELTAFVSAGLAAPLGSAVTSLLLCCCLLIPAASAGEDLTRPSLDVDACVRLALSTHEDAAIAETRDRQAVGARREAWAALGPQLAAQGTWATTRDNGDTMGGTLGLRLRLIDPAAFPALRSALLLAEAQQMENGELRRQLAFAVVEAYVQAQTATILVQAAQRRLEVAATALAQAQARALPGVGIQARSEALRIEVEHATAQSALAQAMANAETSRLTLGHLISQPAPPVLAAPTLPAAIRSTVPELLEEATRRRADLQALDQRAAAARQAARVPKAQWLPSLSLQATSRDDLFLGGADDDNRSTNRHEPDWNVALIADWTLFDGGAREGRLVRLAAQAREASLVRRRELRRLETLLAQALADRTGAQAVLAAATVRTRAADARAVDVAARFRSDLATALEQTDAGAGIYEAAAEAARSQAACHLAEQTLRRLLGRWPLDTEERRP